MEVFSELDLPPEIVSVLPTDPYKQLEIAQKIISMSITLRVGELESNMKLLTGQLEAKDASISHLERRVDELQRALEQSSNKLSGVLEEKVKLTSEKNSLEATVKKLTRDVAKLETFKRTLMHSLQEDENKTPNLKLPSSSSYNVILPIGSPVKSSSSPKGATRSGAVSPKGKSMKSSSKWHSSAGISVSLPTSNRSTAPNSPPHIGQEPATTPRMDGKEFFRKTRNRLSYEQFNDFLANVKELNAHQQTREETLKKVQEIFGHENEDLFSIFDNLLLRHRPSQ